MSFNQSFNATPQALNQRSSTNTGTVPPSRSKLLKPKWRMMIYFSALKQAAVARVYVLLRNELLQRFIEVANTLAGIYRYCHFGTPMTIIAEITSSVY